ncbi:hypothetical protein [Achromobacter aloeverae]|uniref:hypothetical protein n=1 Tax=Achromobacter aloeverae TaxID=1750518 RepID=UPI001F021AC3|nr:hypothetical protein [Achromobacter aloeverae]
MAGMLRAAEMAREIAIQTNTGIVVQKEGKLVHISAEELRKERDDCEKSSSSAKHKS